MKIKRLSHGRHLGYLHTYRVDNQVAHSSGQISIIQRKNTKLSCIDIVLVTNSLQMTTNVTSNGLIISKREI